MLPVESIPDIPLVVGNPVSLEEGTKLVLKQKFAVVLLLVADVGDDPLADDSLTEKAPYPDCHENVAMAGPFVSSHFDVLVLASSTTWATVSVRDRPKRQWTWSATPPICNEGQPLSSNTVAK